MRLMDGAKFFIQVCRTHDKFIGLDELAELMDKMPTVDAAPVVRCKDCKYLNIINKAPLYAYCGKSNYIFHLWEEDTREHFCSWGERREENEMR